VVNAGVIEHPSSDRPVVAFVSRGAALKLADLRRHPMATVVFQSGWEWVAVEGEVEMAGPRDRLPGLDESDVLPLIRRVYAAAVGGEAEHWAHLDPTFVAEQQTAVMLTRPASTQGQWSPLNRWRSQGAPV
jgi:hypothetical protein